MFLDGHRASRTESPNLRNQPCFPISHFAATSAPRAKTARSRTVCVNSIVSDGPSKPTVCVPGTDADARRRHVDRPRIAGAFHPALDRQGRSRRRILLHHVMRFMDPRAELRRAARSGGSPLRPRAETRSCRARNSMPPARRCRPSRRSSRIAASCACQPVVPITTLILRAASCGRFFATASASVKSMATSTSPNSPSAIARSPECSSITPAIVRAVRRRERFDELPHAAVTEQQDAHQLLPLPRSARCDFAKGDEYVVIQSPFTSSQQWRRTSRERGRAPTADPLRESRT